MFTLGSFLKHPQIKSNHPNEETKILTNHNTSRYRDNVMESMSTDSTGLSGATILSPAPLTGGY